jgi:hypothetical protein
MHARARRICGDSHELALRNVPITITITITSIINNNQICDSAIAKCQRFHSILNTEANSLTNTIVQDHDVIKTTGANFCTKQNNLLDRVPSRVCKICKQTSNKLVQRSLTPISWRHYAMFGGPSVAHTKAYVFNTCFVSQQILLNALSLIKNQEFIH